MELMFSTADPAWFVAELPISSRAAAWASEAHAGQERDADGAPFVIHALEVALHLHVLGYRDDIVAAAILHDIGKKTPASLAEVAKSFGQTLAAMVEALTEDESLADYVDHEADLRHRAEDAGDDVLAVFAADKVAKARELRIAAAADRASAREVACKHAHYVTSLELLERRLPDHPFTAELRFELEAQALTPGLAWLGGVAPQIAHAR